MKSGKENIFCPEWRSFMFCKNKRGYINPFLFCQCLQYNTDLFVILFHRQNVMKRKWPVDLDKPGFTSGSTSIRCVNMDNILLTGPHVKISRLQCYFEF